MWGHRLSYGVKNFDSFGDDVFRLRGGVVKAMEGARGNFLECHRNVCVASVNIFESSLYILKRRSPCGDHSITISRNGKHLVVSICGLSSFLAGLV